MEAELLLTHVKLTLKGSSDSGCTCVVLLVLPASFKLVAVTGELGLQEVPQERVNWGSRKYRKNG